MPWAHETVGSSPTTRTTFRPPTRCVMLVLQLDVDFTPLRLIRWERAVELVLAARAYTVAEIGRAHV